MTSFSAVSGIVSFNFDAINIHEVPSNCNCVFRILTMDKNLSKRFTANGNTSSSHLDSSQTYNNISKPKCEQNGHSIKHKFTKKQKP